MTKKTLLSQNWPISNRTPLYYVDCIYILYILYIQGARPKNLITPGKIKHNIGMPIFSDIVCAYYLNR